MWHNCIRFQPSNSSDTDIIEYERLIYIYPSKLDIESDITFTTAVSAFNFQIQIWILSNMKNWYMYPSKSEIGLDVSESNTNTDQICRKRIHCLLCIGEDTTWQQAAVLLSRTQTLQWRQFWLWSWRRGRHCIVTSWKFFQQRKLFSASQIPQIFYTHYMDETGCY